MSARALVWRHDLETGAQITTARMSPLLPRQVMSAVCVQMLAQHVPAAAEAAIVKSGRVAAEEAPTMMAAHVAEEAAAVKAGRVAAEEAATMMAAHVAAEEAAAVKAGQEAAEAAAEANEAGASDFSWTIEQIMSIFDSCDADGVELVETRNLSTALSEAASKHNDITDLFLTVKAVHAHDSLILERDDFEEMARKWIQEHQIRSAPFHTTKLEGQQVK